MHDDLGVHQELSYLSTQLLPSLMSPSLHWLLYEIVPVQVQDFALPLVELVSQFLQSLEVALDSSTALKCTNSFSQVCITRKAAEHVLCPRIQTINEDVDQNWAQY